MEAKHLAVRILGVFALLVAIIYGFYVLMGFITENFSDLWLLASRLLNVAVAAIVTVIVARISPNRRGAIAPT